MLKEFGELDDGSQMGVVAVVCVVTMLGLLFGVTVISELLEHKQEMAKVQALEAGVPYHYLWELPGNHEITPGAVLGEE